MLANHSLESTGKDFWTSPRSRFSRRCFFCCSHTIRYLKTLSLASAFVQNYPMLTYWSHSSPARSLPQSITFMSEDSPAAKKKNASFSREQPNSRHYFSPYSDISFLTPLFSPTSVAKLIICTGPGSDSKDSAFKARDLGLIPGWGRPLGGGHGNPFQYSWLENSMDRGACQATVHGVTKRWTGLSN